MTSFQARRRSSPKSFRLVDFNWPGGGSHTVGHSLGIMQQGARLFATRDACENRRSMPHSAVQTVDGGCQHDYRWCLRDAWLLWAAIITVTSCYKEELSLMVHPWDYESWQWWKRTALNGLRTAWRSVNADECTRACLSRARTRRPRIMMPWQ